MAVLLIADELGTCRYGPGRGTSTAQPRAASDSTPASSGSSSTDVQAAGAHTAPAAAAGRRPGSGASPVKKHRPQGHSKQQQLQDRPDVMQQLSVERKRRAFISMLK
jgi:hypothetical protein